MIDLTEHTFIDELVSQGRYNGIPLQFGCIVQKAYEHGRPGVSGEFSPESRTGNANHASIFIRQVDNAFKTLNAVPNRGDVIDVDDISWTVRIVRGQQGGVWELISEQKGSRAVNYERTEAKLTRVRG